MKLYQIVLKDVMRRKRRALYAALGIVVSTMTVVGIMTVAVAGETKIYGQLEKYGANLSILPAISNVDMQLGNLSLGTLSVGENYIPEEKLPEIRKIADTEVRESLGIKDDGDIVTIAPKLYINGQVKGTNVMIIGVDPAEEFKIKTWWEVTQGKYLEGGDQALVGSAAASALGLAPGDSLDIGGRNMTVTGILGETGSNEDYQIFVPIGTLQQAYNKQGLVSSVDIRALCNGCPVEVIADEINQMIPGVRAIAVKQVAATEMGMVERIRGLMVALAGITLVVGSLGVGNTMMSSVHERIKDIGIMRAVGASRNQIMKIFLYEAFLVGIIGGIIGYVVGTLMAYLIGPLIFEGAAVTYVPKYFPLALGIATVMAIIAALYPSFRATRIKVADSFRSL